MRLKVGGQNVDVSKKKVSKIAISKQIIRRIRLVIAYREHAVLTSFIDLFAIFSDTCID